MPSRPLARRVLILCLEVVAAASVLFLAFLGVAIWRLSSGPVAVGFLTPYIENALSDPSLGLDVTIGETELAWREDSRALDIRVTDVRARSGGAGGAVAVAPQMSVAFSLRALLLGDLAPTRLEVIRPRLYLTYAEDGLNVGAAGDPAGGEEGGGAAPDAAAAVLSQTLLDEMLQAPSDRRRFGHLRALSIRDADLTVIDRVHGRAWRAPGADLELSRDADGVSIEARIQVDVGGAPTTLEFSGFHNVASNAFDVTVRFTDLKPALVVGDVPLLADLAAFDLPVSGALTVIDELDARAISLEATIGFAGRPGRVRAEGQWPEGGEEIALDVTLDDVDIGALAARLRWLEPLSAIDARASAHGTLVMNADGAMQSAGFVIESDAGRVWAPGLTPTPLDFTNLRIEGAVAGGGDVLDIGTFSFDIGGPTVAADMQVFRDRDVDDLRAHITVRGMSLATLYDYWPADMAASARAWALERLESGTIDVATLDLAARLGAGDAEPEFDSLTIGFEFSDFVYHFLPPMQPLVGVGGAATFDGETFSVDIRPGARTMGVATGASSIVLSELNSEDPRARVELVLRGDVPDLFSMMNQPPLALLANSNYANGETSGRAAVRMALDIPLRARVRLDDVAIAVAATMEDARFPGMVAGQDLAAASLSVQATNDYMAAQGEGRVLGAPVAVTLRDNYARGAPFSTRYTVSGELDSAALGDAGFDVADWVWGPVGVAAVFTEYDDGTARAEADLDLTNAALIFDELDWRKAPGLPAAGFVRVALRGGDVFAIDRFTVEGAGLSAEGRVQFDHEGRFVSADIAELAVGRTAIAGRVAPLPGGGHVIQVTGGELDISPYIGRGEHDEPGSSAEPAQSDGGPSSPAPRAAPVKLRLTGNVERMWVAPDRYLSQVSGTATIEDGRWVDVDVAAQVEQSGSARMRIARDGDGRTLSVVADDAGALLRAADIIDNMAGGRLAITGRFDDAAQSSLLIGALRIDDFRLVRAPVLARIVGIAGLTGIPDMLQGEGIGFSALETDFTYQDDALRVVDGRMSGPAIGLTFDGDVDLEAQRVALEGTLAPAYALNGLLSGVPLIGDILAGGEGEGIFAFVYTAEGPMADPAVAVNPLSGLAPGFLRNLFRG